MALFSLANSLKERNKITREQQREIQALYANIAKKAKKKANALKGTNYSGDVQAAELKKLAAELEKEVKLLEEKLSGSIQNGIKKTSQAVVTDALDFNEKIGLSIEGAYSRVPTDILETLITGKLYQGDWTLSGALWYDIQHTQKDINKIVAEGLALNKSSYDIAKDLEMYVNPAAKKPWDWSKVYPGTKKQIDYNAQRLARTMTAHAYQQSVVATTRSDPFVKGIKWISGHTSTSCEICEERDGKVFSPDKLPLDHPNGKCSFAPEVSKSLDKIADELADWANGKPNKDLDDWYLNMRVAAGPSGNTAPSKKKEKTSSQYKYKEIKISGEDWMDWAVDPEPFQEAIVERSIPKYLGGERLSSEASERIKQVAYQMQVEGLTTKIKEVTTAYRGESYDSLEKVKQLYGGKLYTTNKLTSITSQKGVAEEYASIGAEESDGWKVIQIITEPTGVRGVKASPLDQESSEIVCPIGNTYKITGLSVDEEAKTVKVYLFGQDNKKLSKKNAIEGLQ